MRYEVWLKSGDQDVRVYESDLECEARVIVDGVEVYRLVGTPAYAALPDEEATALIVEGGSTVATYVSSTGKEHQVISEEWSV